MKQESPTAHHLPPHAPSCSDKGGGSAYSGEAYVQFWSKQKNTDGVISFIYKEDIESVTYFFLDCSYVRNNFESLWTKLKIKIAGPDPTDGVYICNFIENLDGHDKVLLLLRRLALLFDNPD